MLVNKRIYRIDRNGTGQFRAMVAWTVPWWAFWRRPIWKACEDPAYGRHIHSTCDEARAVIKSLQASVEANTWTENVCPVVRGDQVGTATQRLCQSAGVAAPCCEGKS